MKKRVTWVRPLKKERAHSRAAKIVVVLATIFGFAGTTAAFVSAPKSSARRPRAHHSRVDVAAVLNRKHAATKLFRDTVAGVLQDDPLQEDLIRMLDEYSVTVAQVGGDVFAFDSGVVQPIFQIAPLDPGEQSVFSSMLLDGRYVAIYNALARVIAFETGDLSGCWLGFIGAHELFHAWEHATGAREFPSDSPEAQAAAEVAAYEFEFRIMDRWTGGRFKQLIEHALSDNGAVQESAVFLSLDQLFPPPRHADELGIRHDVFRIALRFREAERSSGDALANKVQALLRFLESTD